MEKKCTMTAGGRPNLIGISGKMGSGKDTLSFILNYLADDKAPDSIARWETPLNECTYYNKKYSEKLKYMVCLLLECDRGDLEDREFKEKELGEEWWYWKAGGDPEFSESVLIPYNDSTGTLDCELIKLTPRLLLQLLGTEAGRHIIHPNIWVNALFADYKAIGDNLLEGEVRKVREEDLIFPNWIITDVRFPNEAQAIKDRGGIIIRINRPQFMANGKVIVKDEHESETALDDYDGFDYVIENDSDSVRDLVNKARDLKIV